MLLVCEQLYQTFQDIQNVLSIFFNQMQTGAMSTRVGSQYWSTQHCDVPELLNMYAHVPVHSVG